MMPLLNAYICLVILINLKKTYSVKNNYSINANTVDEYSVKVIYINDTSSINSINNNFNKSVDNSQHISYSQTQKQSHYSYPIFYLPTTTAPPKDITNKNKFTYQSSTSRSSSSAHSTPTTTSQIPVNNGLHRRVCYFANWAPYRNLNPPLYPDNIDPSLCTHIHYAFAKIDPATLSLVPTEEHDMNWTEKSNMPLYIRLYGLKRRNMALKILLAVGGLILYKLFYIFLGKFIKKSL